MELAGAIADLARSDPESSDLLAALAALQGQVGAAAARQAIGRALCRDRAKRASGSAGAVAASSPAAAAAGARILATGGNAVDAACVAALALTVADPANASVAGRCHAVIRRRSGAARVIDAATEMPARIARPGRPDHISCVPIPGMIAGIAMAAAEGASRRWADLVEPAAALAEDGFTVPEGLAAAWAANRDRLARHPETARVFLKRDGSAYTAGERFSQPALARLLGRVAAEGAEAMYLGDVAADIAAQMAEEGGSVCAGDLAQYGARAGAAVEGSFCSHRVLAPGAQAWGHTLVEMLQIADRFDLFAEAGPEAEILAWILLTALGDRPEELGSLRPKPGGLPLDVLADPAFAAERARGIERILAAPQAEREAAMVRLVAATGRQIPGDTTHVAAVDAEGTAVSLTCSIGPHFGSAVAAKPHGFLYAHSYRMISAPEPGARDATEMCPAILSLGGRPVLAIGGAGSERIPCAVALTAVNMLGRGWSALDAVAAPRLAWRGGTLVAHCDLSPAIRRHLVERGLPVRWIGRGYLGHAGIVHLARMDARGDCEAVADPVYDGVGSAFTRMAQGLPGSHPG